MKAQSVLPAHRRRPLYSSAVAHLGKRVSQEIAKKKVASEEELPAPIPAPNQDSMIEELAETIGRAFAEVFSTALRASIKHTETLIKEPNLLPARKRLPILTIVGLLPAQKNEVESEFGSAFNLRFWKDESPHTLKSLTRTADAVIVMKDWVSHGHVDLVKSVDKTKLRIVPGTTSSLKTYLRQQVKSNQVNFA